MADNPLLSASVVSTIVTAEGIRRPVDPAQLCKLVEAGRFFWLDIAGRDEVTRAELLDELALDASDLAWAQRFGQSGRMTIGRQRLRAVTWIAEGPSLTEIHLLCSQAYILTVWNGDGTELDEIRDQFADRAGSLDKSPFQAAGILLQLLLGTLHHAISELDARLQDIRTQLQEKPGSTNFATLTARLQRLQSAWSDIDRYSSAVRTAIIGVEAIPGIDQRGIAELNDYADQVEDVEHRLQERTRWASDIVQDYATAIAQRQGEQINRLTIVSMIFLPITFLTGFFGMNFNWMIENLGGPFSFAAFGLILPTLSVLLTVLWFKQRGLM